MNPAILTKEHLDQAIFHAARACTLLPKPDLTPEDRRAQRGYQWALAKTFIFKTAHAVVTYAARFTPAERGAIADAHQRQLRAHRLRALSQGLYELAERCVDQADAEEATALKACMELVIPAGGERRAALAGARAMLLLRNQGKSPPSARPAPLSPQARARLVRGVLAALQGRISGAR